MHVVIEQPIDLIRGIADQLDYNFFLSLSQNSRHGNF
jgi:hypothetical protein